MTKKEQQIRDDAEAARQIEDSLAYLALSERGDWNVPDLNYFDGAINGNKDHVEMIARFLDTRSLNGYKRNDHVGRLASGLKSIRGAILLTGQPNRGARYEVMGGRELSVTEKQRIAPIISTNLPYAISPYSNRIVEIRDVELNENGTATSRARHYYYEARGEWWPHRQEHKTLDENGKPVALESTAFALIVGSSYLDLSTWRAKIRFSPGLPSVSYYTDPTGIKEMFRFREIADGKIRRDALAHWVGEHWRQNRTDPEVESYVREHLRGKQSCRWNGMDVEIVIPPSDTAKIEAATDSRKRLASAGMAKRLKAHRRANNL